MTREEKEGRHDKDESNEKEQGAGIRREVTRGMRGVAAGVGGDERQGQ